MFAGSDTWPVVMLRCDRVRTAVEVALRWNPSHRCAQYFALSFDALGFYCSDYLRIRRAMCLPISAQRHSEICRQDDFE